jgi:hypothetical protein
LSPFENIGGAAPLAESRKPRAMDFAAGGFNCANERRVIVVKVDRFKGRRLVGDIVGLKARPGSVMRH